ncbi:MAG: ParB N-terminal domain-containing protein [Anaerolineae bacterium]|jgi:hypothetical protein|nr:ParB N-terminal domain-containing protein [Anaerolineae bacterium]
MPDPFRLSLAQIQPSQLYINTAKLADVVAWWDPPQLGALPPIPVKALDGRIVATDGHTRAFAAYRNGFREVPVVWDEDDLDWEAYRICVDWCLAEGIHTVMDLEGRLLAPKDYDLLWLGRCAAMQDDLAARRAGSPTGAV